MKILYFGHDASDQTVKKRIRSLLDAGIDIISFTMRRSGPPGVESTEFLCKNIDLGQTYAGKFLHRIYAIGRAKSIISSYEPEIFRADIIIARNLEMLALAYHVVQKFNLDTVLIYECLDIHRLMTARGPDGIALRALERHYLKRVSHIIISSPAFEQEYFRKIQKIAGRTRQTGLPAGTGHTEQVNKAEEDSTEKDRTKEDSTKEDQKNTPPKTAFPNGLSADNPAIGPQFILLENKLYLQQAENRLIRQMPKPLGRPLRLGWFGILRCMRSLRMLSRLAESFDGDVKIILAGKPALDALPGFHDIINSNENMYYHGPYETADEIVRLYHGADIIWAGDFSQPGYNSKWLLPNRLYESGAYGVPCCAPADSMTGARVSQLGIGFSLSEPIKEDMARVIRSCLKDPGIVHRIQTKIVDLPFSNFIDDGQAFADILRQIARPDRH